MTLNLQAVSKDLKVQLKHKRIIMQVKELFASTKTFLREDRRSSARSLSSFCIRDMSQVLGERISSVHSFLQEKPKKLSIKQAILETRKETNNI